MKFCAISLLVVCLCCAAAFGQAVTATLVGNISDASGAVVPGAEVRVMEQSTGVSHAVKSDALGAYTIPYLPPGIYSVEIQSAGMKKLTRRNIDVRAGATVRVDASLELGSVNEVVDVKAELPALQTDRADLSKSFDSKSVRELPLIDRNYQAVASLLPGVTESSFGLDQEDPMGNTYFNANGQSNTGNNTMVDGVDNTDPLIGLPIYVPPIEGVGEVNVTTNNYSAEYGRAGGAVLNVITRGGTNQFHGSVFAFNRVTALQARNLFNTDDQPKPNYIRNEFGATFGGPIRRDKTFFFGSYQGRYIRQANAQTGSVPVDAWRRGDFSAVDGTTLYDPASGNADGTGRLPFVGNRIPANRINPIAAKLMSYLPTPNAGGTQSNLYANIPFKYNGNSFDGRVDHNITDSSRLYIKLNSSPFHVTNGSIVGDQIGDGIVADDATTSAIVNFTHGFSPTLLMEARAGFNRYWVRVDPATSVTSTSLGIRIPQEDDISGTGLARIQVNGMSGVGGSVNYPLRNADNIISLIDNFTKIWPKHTVKFGVQVVRLRADRFQPEGLDFGPRGMFLFTSSVTALNGGDGVGDEFANSFASLLLGAPDQTSRTYMTVTPTNRQTQFASFVEDTWQVSRKLTLNLGLRYELFTTVKPRYAGGASNYDPDTNTLLIAGIGGVDMATGVQVQPHNLAPRLGFAYRINDQSVIRGGYGVSYFTGPYGWTGGTLSTQFPVIYNVQNGVTGDYRQDGTLNSIPSIDLVSIPSSGKLSPAPDQGYMVIPKNNKFPQIRSYNVTYQRQILPGTTLDVAYVGSVGRDLIYYQELNYALPGTGSDGLLLYKKFGRLSQTQFRGTGLDSNYNSLQVSANKRFSSGLSFTAAYTWSKSLDYGSNTAGFFIVAYPDRNYGPSDYDRKHQFVASHIYELPFGVGKPFAKTGLPAKLLGGWQWNGIFRIQTGQPESVTADSTPCNCPGNSNFADMVAPIKYLGGKGPDQLWFDPSSFAAPSANRFGNAARNVLRTPGWWNYDASLFRSFSLHERAKLEFRGEFKNLTNTPKWGYPAANVNWADGMGHIYNTWGERQVQFGARVLF